MPTRCEERQLAGIGYVATTLQAHMVWTSCWIVMSAIFHCYDLATVNWDNISGCGPLNVSTAPQYGDDYWAANITEESFLPDDFHYSMRECEVSSAMEKRWSFSSRSMHDLQGGHVLVMLLVILTCCAISAAGIRVLGKFTVFCLVVPNFLLFLIFCRVVSLPGASTGLKFAFFPEAYQLVNPQVWVYLCQLSLHIFSTGLGQAITVGSYNQFNHGFLADCLIAVVIRIVTIIFYVIILFSAYGALAFTVNYSTSDVAEQSVHALPPVSELLLVHTPGGGFWTACLLIAVLLMAVNTAVWCVETVVSAVWDLLPPTPRFRVLRKKPVLLAVLAIPWCGHGLLYCTKGARLAVMLTDLFVSSPVILLCLLECIAVGWVFGSRRFQAVWGIMSGRCSCPYPIIFWSIITPLVLFIFFIMQLVISIMHYDFYMTGLAGIVFTLLVVLISALILLFTRPGTMAQKWRNVTSPWDLADHQLTLRDRRYQQVPMEPLVA